MFPRLASTTATVIAALVPSACAGSDGSADLSTLAPPVSAVEQADEVGAGVEELFPDVLDATATFNGATWSVAATLSSPYDSPERYADAWRVIGPDGTVYGERLLTHDHASEQPFTRSESGIEIPDEVTEVIIEGRDQISGYGGQTIALTLTR